MIMKKVIFLAFILLLSGCAGVSDWSYQLPNNYEIWRINSEEIVIKNMITETNVDEISGFIKEFSYDNRYVFMRNVENISDNNILNETYFVLDTNENKVYGPYDTIEILQKQAKEWDVDLPQKWYRTSPDPNI